MGMSRAGYIPHVCGLTLSNPEVVYELMEQVGSKAIMYSAQSSDLIKSCKLPSFAMTLVRDEAQSARRSPMPGFNTKPDDLAYIYHTSGSVSGRPKPVKFDYRSLHRFTMKWELSGVYDPSEKLE